MKKGFLYYDQGAFELYIKTIKSYNENHRKQVTIAIQSIPLSKNIWKNMENYAKAEYKHNLMIEVWAEGLRQGVKNIPKRNWKKVELSFKVFFKTNRTRDIQNLTAGGLIPLTDILVELDYIWDDCYKVVKQPLVDIGICKVLPRTIIKIVNKGGSLYEKV